ncbi:hypothetical protein Tco_0903206 [Tanacetum coccineum]
MHYPERMKKTRRSQQLFYGLKSACCGVAGRLKVREQDLRRAFSTSPSDGPGQSFRRFSTGAGATPVSWEIFYWPWGVQEDASWVGSFILLERNAYNRSFHSSINMNPYQALYGRVPPSIIPYPSGSSKVAANRIRHEVEFNVGDKVLVKLQPYGHVTLAKRLSNKLSNRYYGPFEVLERVGKVAYRLGLVNVGVANLPEEIWVQWLGSPPEEATWEWLSEFQATYPSHHIKYNVISKEEENVTSQGEGRPKRAKSKPVWHKDYVI